MKKNILIILICICSLAAQAQKRNIWLVSDSTRYVDSLEHEVDSLLSIMFKPKSFFDINLTSGNGFFVQKTTSNINTSAGTIFFTLNSSYLHKSGFGISGTLQALPEEGNFTVFQGSLSPSYDYIKNKKWGFGVSYTRYFNKKDLSFYVSPLTNEYYAYGTYKGGWLRTTFALDYAEGTQAEVQKTTREVIIRRTNGRRDTVRLSQSFNQTTSINDFSTMLSFQHRFFLGTVFNRNDGFSFTPSIIIIAATQRFGTSLQASGNFNSALYNINRSLTNTSSSVRNNFRLQNTSLSLRGEYSINKFYLQPHILIDYTFPSASKQWNLIYNLTAGLTF